MKLAATLRLGSVLLVLTAVLFCLSSCGTNEITETSGLTAEQTDATPVSPDPTRSSREPADRPSESTEAATSPEKEGLLAGFSFDNRIGGRDCNLAETDRAYYGCPFGGNYLYYFDKESKEGGIFCNRPECMHNNLQCGAYVGYIANNSLSAWQGRLYFVSTIYDDPQKLPKYGLWSVAEDGSDRRLHRELEPDEYGTQYKQLHKGNLFGIGYWDTVEAGAPVEKTVLYKLSLETGEKELLFIRDNTSSASYDMKIRDDEVFVLLNLLGSDGRAVNELYCCNWKTGETTQLLNDTESGKRMDEFVVSSDGELYLANWANSLPDGTKKAQLWQLKENQLVSLSAFELEEFYGWHLSSEIALALYPQRFEDGSYRGCVKDYAGNTLYEGKLEMPSGIKVDLKQGSIMQLLWGDQGSLIFELHSFWGSGVYYYLVRFDISGETAAGEILWEMKY